MTGPQEVDWAEAAAGFAYPPLRQRLAAAVQYGAAVLRRGVQFLARGVQVSPSDGRVVVYVAQLIGPGCFRPEDGDVEIQQDDGVRITVVQAQPVACGLVFGADEMRAYDDLCFVGTDAFVEGSS